MIRRCAASMSGNARKHVLSDFGNGRRACYAHWKLLVARTHNKLGDRSFSAAGPRLWNDLPPGLRRLGLTFDSFRQSLKTHLFGDRSAWLFWIYRRYIGLNKSITLSIYWAQGLKKLWNFEARACIALQKNLDFINKNARLVIRTPFQKLRYYFCCINVLRNTLLLQFLMRHSRST